MSRGRIAPALSFRRAASKALHAAEQWASLSRWRGAMATPEKAAETKLPHEVEKFNDQAILIVEKAWVYGAERGT